MSQFPISFAVWLLSLCSTVDRGRSFGAPFLVARGLRILQDFAGICRAILLNLCRNSGGLATHNLLVVGSSPTGPTTVFEVFSTVDSLFPAGSELLKEHSHQPAPVRAATLWLAPVLFWPNRCFTPRSFSLKSLSGFSRTPSRSVAIHPVLG